MEILIPFQRGGAPYFVDNSTRFNYGDKYYYSSYPALKEVYESQPSIVIIHKYTSSTKYQDSSSSYWSGWDVGSSEYGVFVRIYENLYVCCSSGVHNLNKTYGYHCTENQFLRLYSSYFIISSSDTF